MYILDTRLFPRKLLTVIKETTFAKLGLTLSNKLSMYSKPNNFPFNNQLPLIKFIADMPIIQWSYSYIEKYPNFHMFLHFYTFLITLSL